MWNKVQFFVKYKSKVFKLIDKCDIFFFDIKCRIVAQFLLVIEVDEFFLVFENLKPFSDFIDVML